METKVTKRDNYTAIINYFTAKIEGTDCPTIDAQAIVDFANHEIDLLDKKAEKAKASAKKNNASNDELAQKVADILTAEPQTITDVTAAIGDENVTAAKVSYRLTQLAKQGMAEKVEVSVAGTEGQKARKLAAYKLAN